LKAELHFCFKKLSGMKKTLLYFSIFIFSFCKAQDTLVYKGGQKVAVKVISVGDRVIYSMPPNGAPQSVSQSKLAYIKYKDGTRYTIQESVVNQEDFDESNPASYGPININLGIGLSTISAAIVAFFPGDFIGQGAGAIITQAPAYNFTVDYTFNQRATIGIGGAYEWVTDNPYAPPSNNISQTWAIEKMTRYNISLRFTEQFLKTDKGDLYAGVRGGVSLWTDQMIQNNPPNPYVSVVNPTFISPFTKLSIQILLGVRVFPVYNFGFHLETGIGTPYFLEAGITFRFKTKR
jgi:hypothetical protein